MAPNSDILNVPAFTFDVSTWFLQLEAVWSGVTDLTDQQRYQAVVRALPTEVAARLASILAEPPTEKKYEAIKSALMTAFGRTHEAYFSSLDTVRFEGGRPSALLARMTDLNRAAGQPLSDPMLRYRHANLMPHPVRVQLAAVHHTLSAAEYSRLVDKVYDAHMASPSPPPGHAVCTCGASNATQVGPVPPSSDALALHRIQAPAAAGPGKLHTASPPPDTASTEARLAAVEASLHRLEAALTGPSATPRSRYCFYHARFGGEARNCQPPCDWSRQGNGYRGGR